MVRRDDHAEMSICCWHKTYQLDQQMMERCVLIPIGFLIAWWILISQAVWTMGFIIFNNMCWLFKICYCVQTGTCSQLGITWETVQAQHQVVLHRESYLCNIWVLPEHQNAGERLEQRIHSLHTRLRSVPILSKCNAEPPTPTVKSTYHQACVWRLHPRWESHRRWLETYKLCCQPATSPIRQKLPPTTSFGIPCSMTRRTCCVALQKDGAFGTNKCARFSILCLSVAHRTHRCGSSSLLALKK